MSQVSIATKPLVYSTFRYIANTAWNALAEYIDNSLQSYESHKDVLSRINKNGKVCIDIQIAEDSITILDNAWGIEAENYQRAFELANIPLNASGLSEFGMGMKVSSIWFSDVWTVETCAYQEGVKKTVTFDINEVVEKQETALDVKEEPAASTEHYTRITLTKLSQNKPKQIAAIKKHLISTYTKFIRDGELELIINGEVQYVDSPRILQAPFYSKKSNGEIEKIGPDKYWRVDFQFAPTGSKYKVEGFIGVLETMSTDKDNGFLIFRRGRAIGYSGDDKYRPRVLCGQVGSPQYKRIFGELSVDGFDVSFQKNAFQEDEAFADFITDLSEHLKHRIKKGEIIDIFSQAQDYVKDKTIAEKKKTARALVKSVSEEMAKPITINTDPVELDLPVEQSVEVPIETPSPEMKEAVNFSMDVTITIKDIPRNVRIETTAEGAKTGLYTLKKVSETEFVSQINMSNRYFDNFEGTEEEIRWLSYFIKVLITTEISMLTADGGSFRNRFNRFFGSI